MIPAPPRLVLIDGMAVLYRAFYAIRELTRPDGFPTNAVFGFVKTLEKLIQTHRTDDLVMVFDAPGPTFRHQIDPEYKKNRKQTPEALTIQIPIIKKMVEGYRIPLIEQNLFEADDLIGTLVFQSAASESNPEIVILSGDKDLMQLITPRVTMLDIGYRPQRRIGIPEVLEQWGVPPEQVTQVIGLAGDPSDNIPGVPGIGLKTAARLIRTFGDLESVLTSIDQVKGPKCRQNLRAFADQARRSLRLGTIDCHVPLSVPFSREALRRQEPDHDRLQQLFQEMHFTTLLTPPPSPSPSPSLSQNHVQREKTASTVTITTGEELHRFLTQLSSQKAFAFHVGSTEISIAWGIDTTFHLKSGASLTLEEILRGLKPFLENPDISKTGHDLKQEMTLLWRHDIHLAAIRRDVMLLSHLLDSLQRRQDHPGIHLWETAEKRAQSLRKIPALQELYEHVERPLIPVLAAMEQAGVLIDSEKLSELSKLFSEQRTLLTKRIHEMAGEVFNINSPKQLSKILFEKLGIPAGRKTGNGFSTDAAVLTKLAEKGHPLPAMTLEYRRLSKLQSTYTDALIKVMDPTSNRVHTHYHQAATLTGRLSSSRPNLQNIPIRSSEGAIIRSAFVAPANGRLLSADYSQIELRLLAHLGEVTPLRQAFADQRDIHTATAAEIFRIPEEHVTDQQRRMAKTINFGLIYGMSAFGLARQLKISNREARAYMERYFSRYEGVLAYRNRVIQQARERGYAETMLGRRCPVPELTSHKRNLRELAERTAINAPLQGSAADLIKRAMVQLYSLLQKNRFRSRMILQVHDELVLEVPESEIEPVRSLVQKTMEEVAELSVPLVVETGIGLNWAEAHGFQS